MVKGFNNWQRLNIIDLKIKRLKNEKRKVQIKLLISYILFCLFLIYLILN